MAVTATVSAKLSVVQTGSNEFGQDRFDPTMQAVLSIANGTGANQADIAWLRVRTVASATNDDIDLSGVLADAFGATVTAAELVAVFVINAPRSGAANTTALTIGAGSNPVTGFLGGTAPTVGPLRPGAFVMLAAGDAAGLGAVTAGSGDILRIANASGASATYQIGILARTA